MSLECAFFGALGQDGELKTSKSGREYLRLNVRVGDDDAVQWVSVLAFDPDAVGLADKLVKGARVYVEGRLSTNEWTGQDGKPRFGLSVEISMTKSPLDRRCGDDQARALCRGRIYAGLAARSAGRRVGRVGTATCGCWLVPMGHDP